MTRQIRLRFDSFARMGGMLALVLTCACGSPVAATNTESPDSSGNDDVGDDVAEDVPVALDASQDVAPDGPVVCGTAPAPDGCPCQANADCGSSFCLETPNGLRCAAPCTADCPVGYACTAVTKSDGSGAKVCESLFASLCNPCKDNASCQNVAGGGARCVKSPDGGNFCGVGCTGNDGCPPGFGCQDAQDVGGNKLKQCVFLGPGSCACSQSAIAGQLSTPCTISAGIAVCSGERVCLADGLPGAPKGGGLSGCLVTGGAAETCDGIDNNCNGQTDEGTCDDSEPCTDDACSNTQGAAKCTHGFNTAPCEADGSVCTKDDHCADGTCKPGTALNCNDNNLCTADSCDPKAGCTNLPADGTPCDADANDCTVSDSCLGGKCVAGAAKACSSGEACLSAACDAATGACVTTNLDGAPCTDGNPCTLGEACAGGKCVGSAALCDDKSSCTVDVCDPVVGCLHTTATGPCDDGSVCTVNDVCNGKDCVGTPQDATLCEDNNPCTTDSCDGKLGCTHTPANGAFCYDGDDCTLGDHCQGGKCAGTSNVCACTTTSDCAKFDDGNPCNGVHYCDNASVPGGCRLNPASIVTCDTSIDTPCAQNFCDPKTGKCGLVVKSDGLVCNADNNLCTQGDSCKGGACTPGIAPDCDDKNPCTTDACDSAKGCTHTFNTLACNADGDACTDSDHCLSGLCQQGNKKVCDDGEACTYDSCDPLSGQCVFEGAKISCSDNNLCTVGDQCALNPGLSTWGCVPGATVDCDDKNPCTVDSCDPAKGCSYAVQSNTQMACYDGAKATNGVGICHGGTGTCDASGKLGNCDNQQLPELLDVCDGLDNDCDGITDKGCGAVSFTARFGTVALDGVSGSTTVIHSQFGSAWLGGAAMSSGTGPGICLGALPFMMGKQFCW